MTVHYRLTGSTWTGDASDEMTLKIGRTSTTSPPEPSTLTVVVPWRATGRDPNDVERGDTVSLQMSDDGVTWTTIRTFRVVTVTVDQNVAQIVAVAVTSAQLDTVTGLSGFTKTGEQVVDDWNTYVGFLGGVAPSITKIAGQDYGGTMTYPATSTLRELADPLLAATTHGRFVESAESNAYVLDNASVDELHAAGVAPTVWTLPDDAIVWNLRASRDTTQTVNYVTVTSNAGTSTSSNGSSISTNGVRPLSLVTYLDDLTEADRLAFTTRWDFGADVLTGYWRAGEIPVVLDSLTTSPTPIELVRSAFPAPSASQPRARLSVPTKPPTTPGGSWTNADAFVEGMTVRFSRAGSVATLSTVPCAQLDGDFHYWSRLDTSSAFVAGPNLPTPTAEFGFFVYCEIDDWGLAFDSLANRWDPTYGFGASWRFITSTSGRVRLRWNDGAGTGRTADSVAHGFANGSGGWLGFTLDPSASYSVTFYKSTAEPTATPLTVLTGATTLNTVTGTGTAGVFPSTYPIILGRSSLISDYPVGDFYAAFYGEFVAGVPNFLASWLPDQDWNPWQDDQGNDWNVYNAVQTRYN